MTKTLHQSVWECLTTDGRYADRAVGNTHFVDHFGYEFVDGSVAAPRTVVHHIVGDQRRFAVNPIFLFYFNNFCHRFTL